MRVGAVTVLIAGGGLAGIAAALALSARGIACTILETRKKLGGRATSFDDPRSGETLDNCQHVALGCCTEYFALCRRLGVMDLLERHEGIWWIEAGGRTTLMRESAWLPPPAQHGPSLLRAPFLDAEDKATIAGSMLLARTTRRDDWADRTFAAWLDEAGVTPRAQRLFFEPLIVSACNALPARTAASVGLHVLQDAMLGKRGAATIWVSRVPLARLYDPAVEMIESAGGRVRLGASIAELHADHVVLSDGERVHGDRVISALPAERLAKVASAALRASDPRIAAADAVEHGPILGVHLRFDRPVLHTPNAVLVDRATQWLFRKDDAGSFVHAVISDARGWVGLDEPAIVQRVLRDVRACLPGSAAAEVLWCRAVKEKRATFLATPAFERVRPGAAPATPGGLVLAGDWIDTGWPATMEGAVRSGMMAAGVVLRSERAGLAG